MMSMANLSIDSSRLSDELQTLARFSDAEDPAVTRVVYTQPDREARAWLKGLCREAQLEVREDAVGNLFARWPGSDPALSAISTGSHTDAIPMSGKYDGTVGVLGGLEALRALRRSGFRPLRSLELLMFTSEEPTRFGLGCFGSRLLGRAADIVRMDRLRDTEGISLREAARSAGFSGDLETVALPKGYYSAFVELHIEQGPHLDRSGEKIGIVTAIAAPAALRFVYTGDGGHAGAVLMPDRHDALTGAAELALYIEEVGRTNGSPDTVATTGVFKPHPGAVNSIPSRCTMEVDIRDTDLASRDRAVARVVQRATEIAARRGLSVETEVINSDPPAKCDDRIVETIEGAAREAGLSCRRMVSRAYHDSLFMSRVAPSAMIFIPCDKGYSHRPDEYSTPEDIANGVRVLATTMARLAGDANA